MASSWCAAMKSQAQQHAGRLFQQGFAHRRFRHLIAKEVRQLHQIGRPKLQKEQAALHFLWNKPHRGGDHHELAAVETGVIHVTQAPPDLRRLAQRLMKILQVEDGLVPVRRNEVQHGARLQRARFDGAVFLAQSLGEPPFPNRQRHGAAHSERHFVQQAADALLFGRPDISERPSGFEDLANRGGSPALGGAAMTMGSEFNAPPRSDLFDAREPPCGGRAVRTTLCRPLRGIGASGMGARGGAPNGGGNPDVSERTVRVALTSGGMYDRLYERIPEFEHSTGVAVAIGFRGTHPDLNAHLAALDPVPYDLVATHTKYAPSQRRFLAPLEGFDTADFFPSLLDLATIDGALYGIPRNIDLRLLHYRTDLVAAPPATWDELVALARRLTRPPQFYGFVFTGIESGLFGTFFELAEAAGARVFPQSQVAE